MKTAHKAFPHMIYNISEINSHDLFCLIKTYTCSLKVTISQCRKLKINPIVAGFMEPLIEDIVNWTYEDIMMTLENTECF